MSQNSETCDTTILAELSAILLANRKQLVTFNMIMLILHATFSVESQSNRMQHVAVLPRVLILS